MEKVGYVRFASWDTSGGGDHKNKYLPSDIQKRAPRTVIMSQHASEEIRQAGETFPRQDQRTETFVSLIKDMALRSHMSKRPSKFISCYALNHWSETLSPCGLTKEGTIKCPKFKVDIWIEYKNSILWAVTSHKTALRHSSLLKTLRVNCPIC